MIAVSLPSGGRSLPIRTVLAAVCLSAAVGFVVAERPGASVVVALLVLLVGLASRATVTMFAASLLLLAYAPEALVSLAGFAGRPEVQKGAIYGALLPVMLARGVSYRLILPLGGYVVLAALAMFHNDLAPGLSASQMISSYTTLTVGWAAMAVNWRGARDLRLLMVVAVLPLVSVILGVALQLGGYHAIFASGIDGVSRLRGASIAPQLALTAFISSMVAFILWRVSGWRLAPLVFLLDAGVLGLTVSRGAALALGIALAWPVARFCVGSLRTHPRRSVLRIGAILVVAATAVTLVLPKYQGRSHTRVQYYAVGTVRTDATSGRSTAWKEFYAIAERSPLYGHGLGSGPITKIEERGFLAQHNEFLRFFLEGGYVGGGLTLLTIVLAMSLAIARAPRFIRLDLIGIVAGFAALSWTDNTLTSINLTLPLGLLLGVCASLGRGPVTGVRASPERSTVPDVETQEPTLVGSSG